MKHYLHTSLICLLLLSACDKVPDRTARQQYADQLAKAAGLVPHQLSADRFTLLSYQRVGDAKAPITIYIEGDGYAWAASDLPSRDPTPIKPVALQLAAKDATPNVIYLARPCQYVGVEFAACRIDYWTSARFAPDIIRAYNAALNHIKRQSKTHGFNLVGFSGGGAIALLVASHRDDILSVRTVAGNIDHRVWSELHGITPLRESLNAADYAASLTRIAQLHFVGQDDAIIPAAVAQSYAKEFSDTRCIRIQEVPSTTHTTGWAEAWVNLLRAPIPCTDH